MNACLEDLTHVHRYKNACLNPIFARVIKTAMLASVISMKHSNIAHVLNVLLTINVTH